MKYRLAYFVLFNNDRLVVVGGDVIERVFEYFTGKFSKSVADVDGIFFTPKSIDQMNVNLIELTRGKVLATACCSGGMFASSIISE